MKVFNAASYYALYTLTSTIILNIFLGSSVSVNAQQKPIFSCINKRGIWTTVVGTKQGEKNFISWDSTYFITSGYTPKIRCNQVTGRLNLFFEDASEQYISHGRINNQPVICITHGKRNSCQKLLYTLKPDQDGERAVNLLIQQTESNFNTPPLREGSCHTYISLNALIEGEPKAEKICN